MIIADEIKITQNVQSVTLNRSQCVRQFLPSVFTSSYKNRRPLESINLFDCSEHKHYLVYRFGLPVFKGILVI